MNRYIIKNQTKSSLTIRNSRVITISLRVSPDARVGDQGQFALSILNDCNDFYLNFKNFVTSNLGHGMKRKNT